MSYERRWKEIQEMLDKENHDAFVAMTENNIRYLSCTQRINPALGCILIPRKGEPVGISSAFGKSSALCSSIKNIITYGSLPNVSSDEKRFKTALERALKKIKAKKILADTNIKRKAKIKNIVREMRMIKNNDEISLLREAGKIAGSVAEQLNDIVMPGRTEIEIARDIQAKLCEDTNMMPFPVIVSTGNEPHHECTKNKIKKGDAVICDFGAYYKGYCVDMTRTVMTGNNPKAREIYDIVAEAQKVAIKSVRQGIEFKDVDRIARDIINEYGYGKFFIHGLGHGVGLEVHESPNISPKSKDIAKNGMTFTIEPGVYTKRGSVRIEDTVLLENRAELLTK